MPTPCALSASLQDLSTATSARRDNRTEVPRRLPIKLHDSGVRERSSNYIHRRGLHYDPITIPCTARSRCYILEIVTARAKRRNAAAIICRVYVSRSRIISRPAPRRCWFLYTRWRDCDFFTQSLSVFACARKILPLTSLRN